MQCINRASTQFALRILKQQSHKTEWCYVLTVLCVAVNTCRVRHNTTCCLLVCSERPPVANPIFTTAPPISRWMVDCTACTCRTTSLTLLRPASAHSMLSKCGDTSPLGLYSLYSLLFMMSFARVLLPCFSLLHVNDTMRHRKAAAGCVSQTSKCTMLSGRTVKRQISYLHRNRDARHLRNNIRMIICIYM